MRRLLISLQRCRGVVLGFEGRAEIVERNAVLGIQLGRLREERNGVLDVARSQQRYPEMKQRRLDSGRRSDSAVRNSFSASSNCDFCASNTPRSSCNSGSIGSEGKTLINFRDCVVGFSLHAEDASHLAMHLRILGSQLQGLAKFGSPLR